MKKDRVDKLKDMFDFATLIHYMYLSITIVLLEMDIIYPGVIMTVGIKDGKTYYCNA